jgi:hypothetical protein
MTPEEIVDFFAPEQSTIEAVKEWLVDSGISSDRVALSSNKQVIPPDQLDETFASSGLTLLTVDPIRRYNR